LRSPHLGEGLLPVVLEELGVDVQVVVVGGEGLGALGDAGHELLDLQQRADPRGRAPPPVALEPPHRDVGGSDAIWRKQETVNRKMGFYFFWFWVFIYE